MSEALPLDWGARLRQERDRRGWSRAELAAKINAGESSVYRWEEKGDKPHAPVLQALVDLFGKPVEGWGKSIWRVPYMHNAYFTGRERVLTYLHARLGGPALSKPERLPVAVSQARAISGLGGIGKTQTAVEYAHRFEHEYDLVVLVHASSREVLVAELAGLAPLLGLPTYAETDQNRLAEAVKRWLETRKKQVWLLIFDNVEDILLVKEFLPEKGNGAVLLTTRLQAVGKYIHKVELGTLALEEGIQFFQKRLGAGEEPERKVLSVSEREAAEQLYSLLGGLPLALEQAAAYIEEEACSLAEYVLLYQQQRSALLDRRSRIDQDDYPYSVATTWAISFRRVEQANPDAVALLRLLAFLHPDAIPEETLQAVVEDPQRLQEAVKLLQEYSLVQHQQAARMLTIHRLVQAVIQDGLKETERHDWRVQAVLAVNAAFPTSEQDNWEQCERLLSHALLVAEYIEEQEIVSEEAGRLLHETAAYLRNRARYMEAEPLFQRALQIREQLWGPVHPTVAVSLNGLALLRLDMGKYEHVEPLLQRALQIREQWPDPPAVAASLTGLGIMFTYQGQYEQAESFYLRAIQAYEQQPESSETANPHNNLASLYHYQRRYAEAEPLYIRALHLYTRYLTANHPRRAYVLSNLGTLYKDMGRYADAEPLLQQSLHISEQRLGLEHHGVAYPLSNLSALYVCQGKYAEAEPLYQRALRIFEQLGSEHPDLAGILHDGAQLREAQGNHEEARTLYARVLIIREQELGAQDARTRETRQRLIGVLYLLGQHEEAGRLEAIQAESGTSGEGQERAAGEG